MPEQKQHIFNQIKGGLIVSCQALPDEPLYSSFIMSKMAYAAQMGGAAGIRANSPEDIKVIRQAVSLPIIGLIKREYPDSEVYITPTWKEVEELADCKPDIIAMDATQRYRPGGITLEEMLSRVRERYGDIILMGDCATFEEGQNAARLGFDCVGTTLCGYTADTRHVKTPDFALMKKMTENLEITKRFISAIE